MPTQTEARGPRRFMSSPLQLDPLRCSTMSIGHGAGLVALGSAGTGGAAAGASIEETFAGGREGFGFRSLRSRDGALAGDGGEKIALGSATFVRSKAAASTSTVETLESRGTVCA